MNTPTTKRDCSECNTPADGKQCKLCGEVLPLGAFSRNGSARHSYCKRCHSRRMKALYQKRKAGLKAGEIQRRCVTCRAPITAAVECEECKPHKRELVALHSRGFRQQNEVDRRTKALRVELYAEVVRRGGVLFEEGGDA